MKTRTGKEEKIGRLRQLKELFCNPLYLIPLLCSTSLAVYFYYQSLKERELTISIDSTRTQLFSAQDDNSPFEIKFKDTPVKDNVTAMQFRFWNDGKLAIRKEDILTPLTLRFDQRVKILEVKIIKTFREIAKISINEAELNQGVIPISWNILDNNDGAIIQVIYEGYPNANPEFACEIVEQKELFYTSDNKQVMVTVTQATRVLALIGLVIAIICIVMTIRFMKRFIKMTLITAQEQSQKTIKELQEQISHLELHVQKYQNLLKSISGKDN